MCRYFILICLLVNLLIAINCQEKIVRGRQAPNRRAPYAVSLMVDGDHSCGGAVIAPRAIVTAAHCVTNIRSGRISVRAGTNQRSSGGYVRDVSGWQIHPNFNKKSLAYDIAIVYLQRRFPYNGRVQPIRILSRKLRKFEKGVIVGWGSKRENGPAAKALRIAAVHVTPRRKCKRAYGRSLKRTMYCAGFMSGARDACQGDSGGPLVIKGRLAGIISEGNGCGRRGFPGLYTRAPLLRRWIQQNI